MNPLGGALPFPSMPNLPIPSIPSAVTGIAEGTLNVLGAVGNGLGAVVIDVFNQGQSQQKRALDYQDLHGSAYGEVPREIWEQDLSQRRQAQVARQSRSKQAAPPPANTPYQGTNSRVTLPEAAYAARPVESQEAKDQRLRYEAATRQYNAEQAKWKKEQIVYEATQKADIKHSETASADVKALQKQFPGLQLMQSFSQNSGNLTQAYEEEAGIARRVNADRGRSLKAITAHNGIVITMDGSAKDLLDAAHRGLLTPKNLIDSGLASLAKTLTDVHPMDTGNASTPQVTRPQSPNLPGVRQPTHPQTPVPQPYQPGQPSGKATPSSIKTETPNPSPAPPPLAPPYDTGRKEYRDQDLALPKYETLMKNIPAHVSTELSKDQVLALLINAQASLSRAEQETTRENRDRGAMEFADKIAEQLTSAKLSTQLLHQHGNLLSQIINDLSQDKITPGQAMEAAKELSKLALEAADKIGETRHVNAENAHMLTEMLAIGLAAVTGEAVILPALTKGLQAAPLVSQEFAHGAAEIIGATAAEAPVIYLATDQEITNETGKSNPVQAAAETVAWLLPSGVIFKQIPGIKKIVEALARTRGETFSEQTWLLSEGIFNGTVAGITHTFFEEPDEAKVSEDQHVKAPEGTHAKTPDKEHEKPTETQSLVSRLEVAKDYAIDGFIFWPGITQIEANAARILFKGYSHGGSTPHPHGKSSH